MSTSNEVWDLRFSRSQHAWTAVLTAELLPDTGVIGSVGVTARTRADALRRLADAAESAFPQDRDGTELHPSLKRP